VSRWLRGLLLAVALVAVVQRVLAADAVFAGGCFWCSEADFEKLEGVRSAESGYIGGSARDADYRRVSSGQTEHYEAVRVSYDPALVSYRDLVDFFWRTVDVRDGQGQFCDRGPQYRSAVFVADAAEREQAELSKAQAEEALGEAVLTPILPLTEFYPAETYHQDYYKKNPVRYKAYRWNCGRDQRLRALWGSD